MNYLSLLQRQLAALTGIIKRGSVIKTSVDSDTVSEGHSIPLEVGQLNLSEINVDSINATQRSQLLTALGFSGGLPTSPTSQITKFVLDETFIDSYGNTYALVINRYPDGNVYFTMTQVTTVATVPAQTNTPLRRSNYYMLNDVSELIKVDIQRQANLSQLFRLTKIN